MMETIKIVYVDDNIDTHISEYLNENYELEGFMKEYCERQFNLDDTYETLLIDSKLYLADLIVIDSVLFENASVKKDKLTGEEFEIILKKIFPFKEVIVVSQNDFDKEDNILKKYNSSAIKDKLQFFEDEWKPKLDNSLKKIALYRKRLKCIENKEYVEKYFMEVLQQSFAGEASYDELTVSDVDKLIELFESMRKDYE